MRSNRCITGDEDEEVRSSVTDDGDKGTTWGSRGSSVLRPHPTSGKQDSRVSVSGRQRSSQKYPRRGNNYGGSQDTQGSSVYLYLGVTRTRWRVFTCLHWFPCLHRFRSHPTSCLDTHDLNPHKICGNNFTSKVPECGSLRLNHQDHKPRTYDAKFNQRVNDTVSSTRPFVATSGHSTLRWTERTETSTQSDLRLEDDPSLLPSREGCKITDLVIDRVFTRSHLQTQYLLTSVTHSSEEKLFNFLTYFLVGTTWHNCHRWD